MNSKCWDYSMNWYTHMLHRIGRTGRVGNTGRATSFFDERENAGLARPLVKVSASIGKCDFLMRLVKSWVWKHWPCQGFDWREAACAGLACWTFKRGLLLTCFSHVLRRWGCFQSKSPMVNMFRMYHCLINSTRPLFLLILPLSYYFLSWWLLRS